MVTSSSITLGAAGEHFVMCQLLRRGFIAALAPAGVPNADIVVTDQVGDRLCAIQVKSRVAKGRDGGWHMKGKHEKIKSPTLFYAFVDFGEDELVHPVTFVVPSEIVASVLTRAHRLWLDTPGKGGKSHQDGDMRRFLPDYDRQKLAVGCGPGWLEPYRENWKQLSQPVFT